MKRKKTIFAIIMICMFIGSLFTVYYLASGKISTIISKNISNQKDTNITDDSVFERTSNDSETEKTVDNVSNTDESIIEKSTDEKTDRGGMKTEKHQTVTMGLYSFDIPLYWAYSEGDNNHSMYYDAFVDGTAELQISSIYDPEDEVYYEWLIDSKEQDNIIQSVAMWYDDFTLISDPELVEYKETKGLYLIGEFKLRNHTGIMYSYIFPSVENNNWVYFNLIEMDNCDFSYKNDFEQMIAAIYKTE